MKKSVSLKIHGKTYQVKTDQDPAQLHILADFVDKKMKEISNATTVQPTLDLAILTLLNISNDLFEFEKNLKDIFTNLEVVLGRLNSQKDAFNSALAGIQAVFKPR